jgi:lysine-specific demethylase 3
MPPVPDEPYSAQEVPRFSQESPDFTDQFLHYWSQGKPAVVTGIKQQGVWDPEYFIKVYGDTPVQLENCETGELEDSTVADFFQTFLASGSRSGIWKLKVTFSLSSTLLHEFNVALV